MRPRPDESVVRELEAACREPVELPTCACKIAGFRATERQHGTVRGYLGIRVYSRPEQVDDLGGSSLEQAHVRKVDAEGCGSLRMAAGHLALHGCKGAPLCFVEAPVDDGRERAPACRRPRPVGVVEVLGRLGGGCQRLIGVVSIAELQQVLNETEVRRDDDLGWNVGLGE